MNLGNRRAWRQILLSVALVLSVAAIVAVKAQAAPQAAGAKEGAGGNAQNGKQIFASHRCASCHGVNGQGAVGPKIAPPPLELSAFIKQVRDPVGEMPPFGPDQISDADLAAAYAFLKSSQPAQPSAASAGSLNGNAEDGKKLYMADGCYECHGTVGQGSTQTGGARIGPPAISLDAMIQYVHHPTGQMPPYTDKVITDQQLADIYTYLKAQQQPAAKDIPLLNQ
jgi:mono/diheme cytochrome c family protein